MTDDGETEDDVITNGADLYRKFEHLKNREQNSISGFNNSISKIGGSMLK